MSDSTQFRIKLCLTTGKNGSKQALLVGSEMNIIPPYNMKWLGWPGNAQNAVGCALFSAQNKNQHVKKRKQITLPFNINKIQNFNKRSKVSMIFGIFFQKFVCLLSVDPQSFDSVCCHANWSNFYVTVSVHDFN